jgi:hypothetical protein
MKINTENETEELQLYQESNHKWSRIDKNKEKKITEIMSDKYE